MKKVALLLGALTLAACGAQQNNGSTVASARAPSAAAAKKTYLFSADARPVDGDLKEVKLVETSKDKWTATLRTAFYDRLNGKEVDETRQIASGMKCLFRQGFVPGLIKVECSRDQRPVDGDLKELTLVKTGGGLTPIFDASERTAYYDRLNGKAIDETKAIASGLKQMSVIALPPQPVFCTQNAGQLFNPAANKCEGYTNGCQQASMLANGYTQVPAGVTCH